METKTAAMTGMDLLQVAFIVLKLCKVIAWRWWVVLLPIEVSAVVAVGLIVLAIVEGR